MSQAERHISLTLKGGKGSQTNVEGTCTLDLRAKMYTLDLMLFISTYTLILYKQSVFFGLAWVSLRIFLICAVNYAYNMLTIIESVATVMTSLQN